MTGMDETNGWLNENRETRNSTTNLPLNHWFDVSIQRHLKCGVLIGSHRSVKNRHSKLTSQYLDFSTRSSTSLVFSSSPDMSHKMVGFFQLKVVHKIVVASRTADDPESSRSDSLEDSGATWFWAFVVLDCTAHEIQSLSWLFTFTIISNKELIIVSTIADPDMFFDFHFGDTIASLNLSVRLFLQLRDSYYSQTTLHVCFTHISVLDEWRIYSEVASCFHQERVRCESFPRNFQWPISDSCLMCELVCNYSLISDTNLWKLIQNSHMASSDKVKKQDSPEMTDGFLRCGYMVHDLAKFSERWICSYCSLVIKEPYQLLECGHRVCKGCFESRAAEAVNGKMICPAEDCDCKFDKDQV